MEIIYKCYLAESSAPTHYRSRTPSLTLLSTLLLTSSSPFYSFSFALRSVLLLAWRLNFSHSIFLLLWVLGLSVQVRPSPMATLLNDASTTPRAAPLEVRQSNQNQTCMASQKKMASDLQQMNEALNQLSGQMYGFVQLPIYRLFCTVNEISV